MTNAVYHVFLKEAMTVNGTEFGKDSIVEVHPLKENLTEAEFVFGTEPVVMRYDAVMKLHGLNPGQSVVGNRVPKTGNFDKYGFPAVEVATL